VADAAEALEAAPRLHPPVILIQADPGDVVPADRLDDDLRYLFVGHGRRVSARLPSPKTATIDLLRRRPFLSALAILAGRAAPEPPAPAPLVPNGVRGAPPTIEQACARGQLILVADDDPTNRAVIQRQLEFLGYAAEVAETGLQALALWRTGRHALLLTDLHMPEMDGYDLAESIRRGESGLSGARLPILALTANALKGEAIRTRAAGMDDYLTKPVSLASLQGALERWMPAPAGDGSLPCQKEAATFDVDVLRRLIGDDDEAVHEILLDFVDAARAHAPEMRSALLAIDARRVQSVAHKVKSSARAVGAGQLGDLCARLEEMAAAGVLDSAGPLGLQFERVIEEVLRDVERHLLAGRP
jgi:CheY-like chemotaxis protein/HPt (histidine-containing phosphotransfer) domain-containing protein